VNSDGNREKIRAVVREKDINWRSFWNGSKGTEGEISTLWNVRSWPTTYLIDGNGVIRSKNHRSTELADAIQTLLAELDGKAQKLGDR